MNKRFILCCFALVCAIISMAQGKAYNFTNQVTFTKSGSGEITRFIGIMPVPQSDEYQTVRNFTCSHGNIMEDANYGNKALLFDTNEFPGQTLTMKTNFDVMTNVVSVDFSKVKIKDYDSNSEACKQHLGNRGEYINITHPYIVRTGDELWSQSSDIIDYARRCYEYVASHFRYINGSFRTLQQILDEGGGECGDFSTLVVNLLRYKGIPSRHIICLKLNGVCHVWADFYIEGYGWIPLDAQMKNANPRSDYFGKYNGECIVVAKDFSYDYAEVDFDMDFLQTYYYWYWYNGTTTSINGQHTTKNNGQATGLDNISASNATTPSGTYSLSGMHVNPQIKGIVIKDGKKILNR
ncbi:MAG: transglutaminase domain-containing protein [Bacteroidaceae bacterium]|nr:transglutaminase domain-containing protein [Bacteroidaceae bacterium]